jgi:hypothetical protein
VRVDSIRRWRMARACQDFLTNWADLALEMDGQSCAAAITCARGEKHVTWSNWSTGSRFLCGGTDQHDQVRAAFVHVGDLVPMRGHGANSVPGLHTHECALFKGIVKN